MLYEKWMINCNSQEEIFPSKHFNNYLIVQKFQIQKRTILIPETTYEIFAVAWS